VRFFDPAWGAWLDHEIPVSSSALVKGGAGGVFVYDTELEILEKWDSNTGTRIASRLLRMEGKALGMAAAVENESAPVFILTDQRPYFIDRETLRPLELEGKQRPGGHGAPRDLSANLAKILETGFPRVMSASADGVGFLFSTYNPKSNSGDADGVWFSPRLNTGHYWTDSISGVVMGAAGTVAYRRSGVEDAFLRSSRLPDAEAVFIDPTSPGIIAALEVDKTQYVPPSPRKITVYIENGLAANRKEFIAVGDWQKLAGLSGESREPGISIWDRGHLFVRAGKLVAVEADRRGLVVYDLDIEPLLEEHIPLLGSPLTVVPWGEEWSCRIASRRGVELNLLDAPEGARLGPDGILRWKAKGRENKVFMERFSIEALSTTGDSVVSEFELRTEPFSSSYATTAEENAGAGFDPVPLPPSRIRPLAGYPRQAFLGGSGKYLCIVYHEKPQVDIFDVATTALRYSLTTRDEEIFGVANANSLFLFDPVAAELERVNLDNPEDRKRVPVSPKLISIGTGAYSNEALVLIEAFDSTVRASDSFIIGNLIVSRQVIDQGGFGFTLLTPNTLSPVSESFSDDFAMEFNKMMRFGWDDFRILPASFVGTHFLLGGGMLSFSDGKRTLTPLQSHLRSERDRTHLGAMGTYYTTTGSYFELPEGSQHSIRFDALIPIPESEYMLALDRRNRRLVFYSPSREKSVLALANLSELDQERPPFEKTSRRFTDEQQLFYVPSAKRVITVSRSQTELHFRSLDLDEMRQRLR
ncbi:MAG: hypothetical protein AAF733_12150, partial [Verrucomicrobiota bacterium]